MFDLCCFVAFFALLKPGLRGAEEDSRDFRSWFFEAMYSFGFHGVKLGFHQRQLAMVQQASDGGRHLGCASWGMLYGSGSTDRVPPPGARAGQRFPFMLWAVHVGRRDLSVCGLSELSSL